ncbi:MAG: hypothetical protein U1F11_12145 [Steroidobacteraceae bacterium]
MLMIMAGANTSSRREEVVEVVGGLGDAEAQQCSAERSPEAHADLEHGEDRHRDVHEAAE